MTLFILVGECTPRKPALCLTVKKDSPNKGKRFYTCQENPKKCDFFLWFVSHTAVSRSSVYYTLSKGHLESLYEHLSLHQIQGGRSNEARARRPSASQL